MRAVLTNVRRQKTLKRGLRANRRVHFGTNDRTNATLNVSGGCAVETFNSVRYHDVLGSNGLHGVVRVSYQGRVVVIPLVRNVATVLLVRRCTVWSGRQLDVNVREVRATGGRDQSRDEDAAADG